MGVINTVWFATILVRFNLFYQRQAREAARRNREEGWRGKRGDHVGTQTEESGKTEVVNTNVAQTVEQRLSDATTQTGLLPKPSEGLERENAALLKRTHDLEISELESLAVAPQRISELEFENAILRGSVGSRPIKDHSEQDLDLAESSVLNRWI